MAWTTPKTDWNSSNGVTDTDLNRIESNILELYNTKLASSAYTAADVLAKLLTVDGAGSSLDADLLDGVQGVNYVRKDTSQTMSAMLVAQSNTSYTTKQMRNITLSTSDPSGGDNGDVWIKYAP